MADRKTISRRKMHGLKTDKHCFAQIGHWPYLSDFLDAASDSGIERVYFAGALEQMTREWVQGPLNHGWFFQKPYIHKHRSPVYGKCFGADPATAIWRTVQCKLIGHREGWFPRCEDQVVACDAWRALESEWEKSTGLPLLSSPRATGIALLWEHLPLDGKTKKAVDFPCLPDDLAKLIRSISPQHRIEQITVGAQGRESVEVLLPHCYQYDGRWMYAAMCGLDRFPVGAPRRVGGFKEYQPGFYHVEIRVPRDWRHIGLIPMKDDDGGWCYPSEPGEIFATWAAEPELTLAVRNGWEIMRVFDGYAFDKGRPLDAWANKLIELRAGFQKKEKLGLASFRVVDGEEKQLGFEPSRFAAAACRQILNHTIGAIHRGSEYEREKFVPDSEWRDWRRTNAHWFDSNKPERVEDIVHHGWRVSEYERRDSPFDIFMPHWSATLYSLARARVAQWALKCDPKVLVKIHGDAIYSTAPLPFEDNGRLGQLRGKL